MTEHLNNHAMTEILVASLFISSLIQSELCTNSGGCLML